jgi:flagellar protein FliS
MEDKNPAKAHENIVKVENIIQNFRETLDKRYPVWKDFENVYVYLLRRCHEANMTKDPEIMEEVRMHLRSMRDNWKEVMKTAPGMRKTGS